MTVRRTLAGLVFALFAIGAGTCYAQATWPSRVVKIIVPFAPGGSSDGLARAVAERLSLTFKQPFVVENKPGANSTIGATIVNRADPDGYTLLLMPGTQVLVTKLGLPLTFDPIDGVTPIAALMHVPFFLVSSKQSGLTTLRDAIQFAKKNPGSPYGNQDAVARILAESVARTTGTEFTHVPYKGGSQVVADVLGGHLTFGAASASAIAGYYKDRTLNILAVTSEQRMPQYPDIPTVAEALDLKDFSFSNWYVLAGPPKLPKEITQKLSAAISELLSDEKFKRSMADQGLIPMNMPNPEALLTFMHEFAKKNGAIIDVAKIRAD